MTCLDSVLPVGGGRTDCDRNNGGTMCGDSLSEPRVAAPFAKWPVGFRDRDERLDANHD